MKTRRKLALKILKLSKAAELKAQRTHLWVKLGARLRFHHRRRFRVYNGLWQSDQAPGRGPQGHQGQRHSREGSRRPLGR